MKESVKTQVLLGYLQGLLTEYLSDAVQFGADDRIVKKELTGMLACKSMVENLIGEPVNLRKSGKVEIGF